MRYRVISEKCGRYIKWCDGHWYETTSNPMEAAVYDECEVDIVREQLYDHYQYQLSKEDIDTNERTDISYQPKGCGIADINGYIRNNIIDDGERMRMELDMMDEIEESPEVIETLLIADDDDSQMWC